MSGFLSSIGTWLAARMPTREKLEKNRWLRPFANIILRPDLWRFNRRSVPRAVALGLFTGILIPFAHTIVAALTAVFVRANVPIAIVTTWTSNPATWVVIFPSAFWVSNRLGYHADMKAYSALMERHASIGEWVSWLLSDAAPALMVGLFVIATITASIGYLVTSLGWRFWIASRRRGRVQESPTK